MPVPCFLRGPAPLDYDGVALNEAPTTTIFGGTMSNVLLVEPEQLMRHALAAWLREQPNVSLVIDVGAVDAAVDCLRTQSIEAIVMEWNLPGVAGLELVERWRRQYPQTALVVTTRYTDDPFPSRLLQTGVAALLSKYSPLDELRQGLRAALNGQRFVGNDIAQRLAFAGRHNTEKSPFDGLSNRELQVMMMFAEGMNVQTISSRLCVSPKTVSTYRYRMFEKLGVRGAAELTRLAYRYGILDHGAAPVDQPTAERAQSSRH